MRSGVARPAGTPAADPSRPAPGGLRSRATRLVLVLFEAREPSAVDHPLGGGDARLGLAERDEDSRVQRFGQPGFVVAQLNLVEQLARAIEVAKVAGDQRPDQRSAPHVRAVEDVRAAHGDE